MCTKPKYTCYEDIVLDFRSGNIQRFEQNIKSTLILSEVHKAVSDGSKMM